MTPQEKRRKIAEALGWLHAHLPAHHRGKRGRRQYERGIESGRLRVIGVTLTAHDTASEAIAEIIEDCIAHRGAIQDTAAAIEQTIAADGGYVPDHRTYWVDD